MTPAAELRAAAERISESAKPIVTCWGSDIGGVVEDWFKVVADEWAALDRHNTQTTAGREYPDEPDDVWRSALVLARAINGGEREASATQPMPTPAESLDYFPEDLRPAEVLTGEVTSPYGPCNGLTADSRDNTCTNFAAEYVGYPSTTTGLIDEHGTFSPATSYRRLCTACADSIPDVYERRPLTTTPGGYPVERAA